jgi:hypothetical protein
LLGLSGSCASLSQSSTKRNQNALSMLIDGLQRGSRFKGYTSFVVQDLMIRPHVVNFRC